MNNSRIGAILGALLLLAACNSPADVPPLKDAAIGGPFALTGEDGTRIESRRFAGKYQLIYFGYTYCPDVCPTDVQNLMKGLQLFTRQDAARAGKIVPLFITLDPKRDTPAVLKQWTNAFDPRLIGLTGSEAEIDAVAKAYAVYFKRDAPNAQGAYLVDHARMALLFGPDTKPIAIISQDKDAQTIATELDRWVK